MKSWFALLAASCINIAIPLLSSSALAQGVYGVTSGLVLEVRPGTPLTCPGMGSPCCGGVSLEISPGTFYLAGSAYAWTDAQSSATLWTTGQTTHGTYPGVACGVAPTNLLDMGALAINTPYYCYMYATVGPPSVPTPICSLTAPYSNGQPGAILHNIGSNAVFIGSFLTDSNGSFVPMHRVGEQVLLSPRTQTTASTGIPGYSFNGGVGYCVWPQPPGLCSGGFPSSFQPYYPATASAGIFDVHVVSTNGIGVSSLVQFLDPHIYNMALASVARFLEKPWKNDELLEVLAALLPGRSAAA